jgi:hypothetical protein
MCELVSQQDSTDIAASRTESLRRERKNEYLGLSTWGVSILVHAVGRTGDLEVHNMYKLWIRKKTMTLETSDGGAERSLTGTAHP